MSIEEKTIATPDPKDDDNKFVDTVCSAEFGSEGCKDFSNDAEEAEER
ncbi:MAG: hypothetical protein ACOYJC_11085 [Christensenellales bacterium]|jgi:hypothetical protein